MLCNYFRLLKLLKELNANAELRKEQIKKFIQVVEKEEATKELHDISGNASAKEKVS